MSETYLVPGNTWLTIAPGTWAGQSFTPLETHTLDYIDLDLTLWASWWRHLYEIYETTLIGHPTGTPIASNYWCAKPFHTVTGSGRHRIGMSSVQLNAQTTYALVIRCDPTDDAFTIFWNYQKDTGNYPRGRRLYSPTAGASWIIYPDDDHIFGEFGQPPAPPPFSPPPIENFAVMDIQFLPYPDGLIITVATNDPCHLTCYWTDVKPQTHYQERVVRGASVPWSTYFCFVAWNTVEQQEEGDTLYHTFVITPWPYCVTKWFTFRGEVDEVVSPSVGPIFSHHNTTPGYSLFQHLNVGCTSPYKFSDTNWVAQTFTVATPHNIGLLRLKLSRDAYPGVCYASIKHTDAMGYPTGGDLVAVSFNGDLLPAYPLYETLSIYLPITALEANTYAIVLKAPFGGAGIDLAWWGDASSPPYVGGSFFRYRYFTDTWVPILTRDGFFEDWGYV